MSTSDYVDVAIRRYRQIVPEPITNYDEFPDREVRAWLENDVCATVEDFVENLEFQEWATRSVRSLAPGSGTPERALLEATATAIQRSASCLWDLVQRKTLRRHLGILHASPLTDESRSARILISRWKRNPRARPPRTWRSNCRSLNLLPLTGRKNW